MTRDLLIPMSSGELAEYAVQPHSPGATKAQFAAQSNRRAALPVEAYGQWQVAYSFFNERLFGGNLPDCMITLTRTRMVAGYFCNSAFENREGSIAHEISMNPEYLSVRGDAESYSTLVHEMCHLERFYGRPNRKGGKGTRGYHDRVWAESMIRVGLMPSDTGAPGGKTTGYAVSHFIIEGGGFEQACSELLGAGLVVDWRDARVLRASNPQGPGEGAGGGLGGVPPRRPRNTRTCFVCSGCDLRAWARRSASLSCNDCSQPLVAR